MTENVVAEPVVVLAGGDVVLADLKSTQEEWRPTGFVVGQLHSNSCWWCRRPGKKRAARIRQRYEEAGQPLTVAIDNPVLCGVCVALVGLELDDELDTIAAQEAVLVQLGKEHGYGIPELT